MKEACWLMVTGRVCGQAAQVSERHVLEQTLMQYSNQLPLQPFRCFRKSRDRPPLACCPRALALLLIGALCCPLVSRDASQQAVDVAGAGRRWWSVAGLCMRHG